MEKELRKELRATKKSLKELSRSCFIFLRRLDETMKMPEGRERGRTIAALSNQLERANDIVRHFNFGLGIDEDSKAREWEKEVTQWKKR
ncbi:MAG: hypothetical protein PHG35_02165 [Dehalococcoidales bacterium]|nr:hypothetical protein [Dehalococcoidales bacterium]